MTEKPVALPSPQTMTEYSDWPPFKCEGCGLIAVDTRLPAGWSEYGESKRKFRSGKMRLAAWCEKCGRKGENFMTEKPVALPSQQSKHVDAGRVDSADVTICSGDDQKSEVNHTSNSVDGPVVQLGRRQVALPSSPAPTPHGRISIEVYQHDWMPGFAAFNDDGWIAEAGRAHVTLNLGSLLCAVETGDLEKKDLPYLIAESLMHEAIHALEAWANVEFSEDRVEELLTKYREKYERATIWEYTGAEPKSESGVSSEKAEEVSKGEFVPVGTATPVETKRFRVLTPSGVIADGAWLRREDIPARIPDRMNNYFDTSEAEIIEESAAVQKATPVETASSEHAALRSRIALKVGQGRGILLTKEELRIVYELESQLTQVRELSQEIAAECYQLAGVLDAPVRVLDSLSAAASGEPFVGFLPISSDECELVVRMERAELELTQVREELAALRKKLPDGD